MQDVTRAPTADEQGGMDWWNAQSEQLRSYWLKEVGSTTASAPASTGPPVYTG